MMFGMPTTPPWIARHRAKLLIAVAVVLLVTVVGPFVYIHLIKSDPADPLTLADAPSATSTTATPSSEASSSSTPAAADGIDGTWTVLEGSKAQYRVKEVLFGQDTEATGSTDEVTGSLTASGATITAVEVSVDMASVTSDESRRDGQFRGRIMRTDEFPTATFRLSGPIDLGTLPADGAEITVEATGELTLRGVTHPETFELRAKLHGGSIVVSAAIPVDFDDYDIPDASGGPASVGRNGTLEVALTFVR
jgi:polyisoprenoid-binding protein YceI